MTELYSIDSAETLNAKRIRPATPDEFLPPLGQWATIGGLVILGGFVGAIVLAAVLPYKVVIKAPAVVRPSGELRLVEAGAEGIIETIKVEVNQTVQAGQVLATIDNSRLQTQIQQQREKIDSRETQLRQIEAQLTALEQQIAAETEQQQQAIAAAGADLRLAERDYQESITVTQADLDDAEAALNLSQDELSRFRQLADTGAVSELQIREKVASVEVAQARLKKVRAALNPSNAAVDRAQEQVMQAQSRGNATLAQLQQDQEERRRQHQDLESQLDQNRQELVQLEQELNNTEIRAPIAGIILALNLRNTDQVVRLGDEVAQIAPADEVVVVKAMVASQDINQVDVGQTALVRISACPYPDYGTLKGTVNAIAPDTQSSIPNNPDMANSVSTNSPGTYAVTIGPDQLSLSDGQQDCLIHPGLEGRADIISRQESVLKFVLRKAKLWVS